MGYRIYHLDIAFGIDALDPRGVRATGTGTGAPNNDDILDHFDEVGDVGILDGLHNGQGAKGCEIGYLVRVTNHGVHGNTFGRKALGYMACEQAVAANEED